MNEEELLHRITANPGILGGKPIVRDMRIPVELILSLLAQGTSYEKIKEDYPDLEREDIQACLAFARAAIAGDRLEAVQVGHGKHAGASNEEPLLPPPFRIRAFVNGLQPGINPDKMNQLLDEAELYSASPEVESPRQGFLETARSLSVSGPGDWAEKIEHYLQGPLADDE